MRNSILIPFLGALAGTLVACGGGELFPHNGQLVAAMDGQPGQVDALSGQQLEAGTELVALENANLRREPAIGAAVLVVIPKDATIKVLEGAARDGFYKVAFAGSQGWSYGAHYSERLSVMTREQALTTDEILNRAATGVGFSYWWGHGVWNPGSTSHGSCSGSCPSCTHSGSYGADCSGFAAKVWQVPSTNTSYTVTRTRTPPTTSTTPPSPGIRSRATPPSRVTRSSTTRMARGTSSSTRRGTPGARCGPTSARGARTAACTT